MTKGARLVRAAMPLLLMQSLVSCSVATQSGSQSITPSGSEMPTPTPPRSTAPSSEPSPTLIPVPPDFTVSWTEMPWTGRVWGLSYDAKLGDWMAMGTEEMRTSPDGATWQRHAFQGENLGPGCPDPQPPRMVDAVRMGDRLFAAGTWDNDCDVHALLMWSSLDGATWQVVPQGARVGSSAHAIATNGSTLTVANTFYAEGTGDVITSTVGSGWTSHVARSPAAILDVYGDADGFIAVGYRLQTPLYGPVIWTSEDGSVWLDASPTSGKGRMRSVVRASDGSYVAAGLDGDGAIRIWHSDGDQPWTSARLPSPGVAEGAVWPEISLVASGDRMVLCANTVVGWWYWTSNDGRGWSAGQAMGASGSSSFGPFVAMGTDRIVAFLHDAYPDAVGSHVVLGQIVPAE